MKDVTMSNNHKTAPKTVATVKLDLEQLRTVCGGDGCPSGCHTGTKPR